METIKRGRGRPPKNSTIEKRQEKELKGEPVRKVAPKKGRPPLTFEQRPEHIRFVLDCAAVGYSPTRIVALLKERYGATDDRVISVSTVDGYRKRYFNEIQKREKELRAELPVLEPVQRIRYLQRLIDEASEGTPIGFDKAGQVVLKKDFNAVIQAVREINAMQRDLDEQRVASVQEIATQRHVQEQKTILREFIDKKVAETGKTPLEVLQYLNEDKEYLEFNEAITQLASEYKM